MSAVTDDGFAGPGGLITHDEALALIAARVRPIASDETLPIVAALGRVLAEPVTAPRDVPLSDNAAVDGWAFRAADYAAVGGFFPVVGRIAAGPASAIEVPPGAAVRIFTGAALPVGVDTVAMQEHCETHEQDGAAFVVVPPGLAAGTNRRRAGEDLAAGAVVMAPGLRLRPQDVAGLASMGRTTVTVRRRLTVAVFSTGDEVVRPGQPIGPGQIYDSNHALLTALLTAAGVAITDLGVLPDRAAAVREGLAGAAGTHDVVLSSGGASRGEEDHVAAALEAIGRRHLWQIAIKPGRPLTFGTIGRCTFIGLPGNPVAAFANFLFYALPVLRRLEGADAAPPPRYPIPAAFSLEGRQPGRREFLRGRLVQGPDGMLTVAKFPRDGSGLITGLREADGFIEIGETIEAIAPGTPVPFVPFSGFF